MSIKSLLIEETVASRILILILSFAFRPIRVYVCGIRSSNGSGKTTLAMSILWALTGSLDLRPMQDSKVSDVVNQDSKVIY